MKTQLERRYKHSIQMCIPTSHIGRTIGSVLASAITLPTPEIIYSLISTDHRVYTTHPISTSYFYQCCSFCLIQQQELINNDKHYYTHNTTFRIKVNPVSFVEFVYQEINTSLVHSLSYEPKKQQFSIKNNPLLYIVPFIVWSWLLALPESYSPAIFHTLLSH